MLENLKFCRMNNEQEVERFLIYERGLVNINIIVFMYNNYPF